MSLIKLLFMILSITLILQRESFATTILGDSIGVGIKSVNPNYTCSAKVGISSSTFLQKMKIPNDDKYIISLGSNNPTSKQLKPDLIKLRKKLSASTVVWIIPANTKTPLEVAKQFGDKTISFKAGKDGIHPKSYKVFKGI